MRLCVRVRALARGLFRSSELALRGWVEVRTASKAAAEVVKQRRLPGQRGREAERQSEPEAEGKQANEQPPACAGKQAAEKAIE